MITFGRGARFHDLGVGCNANKEVANKGNIRCESSISGDKSKIIYFEASQMLFAKLIA